MKAKKKKKKKKNLKYEYLWSKITDLIGQLTKSSDEYDEKFNWDDELPLNKTIEIPKMIIVVRAVCYYPQQVCFR